MPSASARSLAARRTGVLGLFFPNLYFDEVLRGSEREAWRHGFALMVGVGRESDPAAMVNDIAGRVDGMAVLARSVPDDLLDHVSRRIPVVLIAGPRRGDDYDHVSVIVTGFDGIEAGRLSSPRLTTMHQPMAELGRAAVRAMLSRLEHPDQPPITSRLPVKVLLRESSEGSFGGA